GIKTTLLRTAHAFHHPAMAPLKQPLREAAATLHHQPATIPVITPTPISPEYWADHLVETVDFHRTITTLHTLGTTTYLEIAPHSTLTPHLHHTLDQPHTITTPNPHHARTQLHLHEDPGTPALQPPPPTYPFQHSRYWLDTPPQRTDRPDHEKLLWQAVDDQDAAAVAGVLRLPADRRDALDALLPALTAWRRQDRVLHRLAWEPVPEQAGPAQTFLLVRTTAAPLPGDGITDLPVAPGDDVAATVRAAIERERPDGILALDAADALVVARLDVPLWVVSRGAHAITPDDPPADPDQAALWDRVRTAAAADPAVPYRLLDLPAGATTDLRRALAGDERQVALRPGGRYARRLVPVPAAASAVRPAPGADPTVTTLAEMETAGARTSSVCLAVAPGLQDTVPAVLDRAGELAPGTYLLADPATTVTPDDMSRRLWQRVPAALAALPEPAPTATATTAVPRIADLPAEGRLEILLAFIREQTAGVLGHSDPDAVGADADFLSLGLTSVTALDLTARFSAVGLTLNPAAVYDNPTPAELAGHLHAELGGTTDELEEQP
ncbi:phosphopantetheine-binding protein, partial [Micromonospora endolithica]